MNIFPKKELVLPDLKNLFQGKPKTQVRLLPPKKDINLLPESVLEQRRFDRYFRYASLAFAVFLTIAVTILIIPFGRVLTLDMEKSQLINKIEEASVIEELEKEVQISRQALQDRQEFITWLNSSDTVVAAVFASMEKVIPETLFLTEVSQQTVEGRGADVATRKTIIIKGEAKDKDSVAAFQNSLVQTALYESVFIKSMGEKDEKNEIIDTIYTIDDFGGSREEQIVVESDEKIVVSFEIECRLKDWRESVEKP